MNIAANNFRRMLIWNHELAGQLSQDDFPKQEFSVLQDWQQARLKSTYADFMAKPDSAPACQFFLQELYGGEDFQERDQDVARVAPVMTRLLHEQALQALSESFRLQGISLELDMKMASLMRIDNIRQLDVPAYAEVYRKCDQRVDREQQIELIRTLGMELDRLVQMPMLLRLVRLMRKPAVAAGFGRLQSFLEDGITSFRQLGGAGEFIDAIYAREWRAMEKLFDGSSHPFDSEAEPEDTQRDAH